MLMYFNYALFLLKWQSISSETWEWKSIKCLEGPGLYNTGEESF